MVTRALQQESTADGARSEQIVKEISTLVQQTSE